MTKTTALTRPTFRKTKNGDWVVFGPANLVRPGTVTVTKRNGTTKTVQVHSVGKPFKVGSVNCVYGYLDDTAAPAKAAPARRSGYGARRECDECGEFVTPGSVCWETGLKH